MNVLMLIVGVLLTVYAAVTPGSQLMAAGAGGFLFSLGVIHCLKTIITPPE